MKKRLPLIVFIIGLAVLAGGVTFLLINIFSKPDTRDADYLVEIGTWTEQDADSVIWQFTEIGKGTLTTNNHTNDYDFIWAIEGDKLKIETKWLYELEDEYTYKIDQRAKTLTLTTGEQTIIFNAKASED